MAGRTKCDFSWDRGNGKPWDKKFREWENRDWIQWFKTRLSFPFEVERKEDTVDACFSREVRSESFRFGRRRTVLSIEDDYEDDLYGMLVQVWEGAHTGYVPLADTEVVSRTDKNFRAVREYAVWWANR